MRVLNGTKAFCKMLDVLLFSVPPQPAMKNRLSKGISAASGIIGKQMGLMCSAIGIFLNGFHAHKEEF